MHMISALLTGEVGRQVAAKPFDNWNCVTRLLIGLSMIAVWSAPPNTCPAPCHTYLDCESCARSDGGGDGGPALCYWSSRLNMVSFPFKLAGFVKFFTYPLLLFSISSSMIFNLFSANRDFCQICKLT